MTSITSSIVLNREVISTSSISGFPFTVESHKELIHIASNCSKLFSVSTMVFSAISPVIPLCTSSDFTIGHIFRSCRSLFLLYSGMASFSRCTLSLCMASLLRVYGTSISSPPVSSISFFAFSLRKRRGPSFQLSP